MQAFHEIYVPESRELCHSQKETSQGQSQPIEAFGFTSSFRPDLTTGLRHQLSDHQLPHGEYVQAQAGGLYHPVYGRG